VRTPFSTPAPFPIASAVSLALVVFAATHHWLAGLAAAAMAFAVLWTEMASIARLAADARDGVARAPAPAARSWRQYREAKREARLLEELTASLAAPCAEVSRLTRMGLDTPDKSERAVMRRVAKSTGALLDFLEDESQLASLRDGDAALAKLPFPIERAVSRSARTAAEDGARVRAELRYHISRDVPSDVCGDEQRLTQLLRVMTKELLPYVLDGALTLSVTSRGEYFGVTRVRFAYRAQGVLSPDAAFSPRAAELCQRLVNTMGGALCLERQHYADAQFENDFPIARGSGPRVLFESLP
jgi:hypothetical protein